MVACAQFSPTTFDHGFFWPIGYFSLQKSKLSCPKYLISLTANDFLARGSWQEIHATGVKSRDTTEYTAQHVHVARDRLRLQAEHRGSTTRSGGRSETMELRREDGAASQGL